MAMHRLGWALAALLSCVSVTAGRGQAAKVSIATVVQTLKIPKGICVVVGDPTGSESIKLARASQLKIYIQVASPEQAAAARQAIDRSGLLGSRIFVSEGGFDRIHMADNLADVAAVLDADAAKRAGLKAELLRVLRPGAMLLMGDQQVVKNYAEGMDDWSHPYHGPDNNPQSNDRIARGPYLTQFLATPWYATMPQMTVISGGRIFKAFGNRASAQPQWPVMNTLMCISAYNGTVLWRRPLKADFMLHRNTMVATEKTLYLADDQSCKLIDAATGKVQAEIIVPTQLSDGPVWKWMALQDGVLYALVGEKEPASKSNKGTRFRGAGWPWWKINNYKFGFGRTLLAVDPKSKKVLWHHREEHPIDSRGVCMSKGRIYYYCHGKKLARLNAKTGKVDWKTTAPETMKAIGEHDPAQHWMKGFASTAYIKCSDQALFFSGPTRKNLVAVSAEDGKLLWRRPGGNTQLVIRDDAVYSLGEGRVNESTSSFKIEPVSGKILAKFPSRDRCTRATGGYDSIFTRGGRGGSTAVFDVAGGKPSMSVISPMRPACQDGVVVAHGHLYWGPWKCRCDGTQIGVIALGPAGQYDHASKASDQKRLESTQSRPSQGEVVQERDWPTFRKDHARGGVNEVEVPENVASRWTATPTSRSVAAAPIVVGKVAYQADATGAVRAIDVANGSTKWTAYTGGAIRFSPAFANDRLYCGSGDGWVYCFDAATGKRLWRFRAAPIERRIPVYGSLLSTWPVGGGVVVDSGVVYAAAGNANYDGTHVYALDAITGKIRWQNNTSGHMYPKIAGSGAGVQSHLLLHEKALYMSGGGQAPMVAYDIGSGKCSRRGGGRGKDLFVVGGQVQASGNPLYWRQEDSHFISKVALETPAGRVAISDNKIALGGREVKKGEKANIKWTVQPFQEIAAVVSGKNAIVAAGLDRHVSGKTSPAICAIDLASGKQLWKSPLPADPVSWGIALGRNAEVLVSLQSGQLVCLSRRDSSGDK